MDEASRITKVRAAPGNWCCDDYGRIAMLARTPMAIDTLVRFGVSRGEGTYDAVWHRVCDMIAAGVLIES